MLNKLVGLPKKVLRTINAHRASDPNIGFFKAIGLMLEKQAFRKRLAILADQAMQNFEMKVEGLSLISDSGNAVFKIVTNSSNYVLRISYQEERPIEMIKAELAWLSAITQELGIAVPGPVATKNGELIQQIDIPGTDIPTKIVLFSWMEGASLGREASAAQMEKVGNMMARLHQHALGFKLPENTFRPNWEPLMLAYWSKVEKTPSPLSEEQFKLIKDAWAWAQKGYDTIKENTAIGLAHMDLQYMNIWVNNGEVGAIDLDDCQFGPLLADLTLPLAHFTHREDFEQLKVAFLKGYTSIRALNGTDLGAFELFYVLNALKELKMIFSWPRITYKVYGPDILRTEMDQLERFRHLYKTQM